MKFEYTYTRLNVSNYQVSKKFYQDVLGFEVVYADDKSEYAELATGETKITLFNRQNLKDFVGVDEAVTYDAHYGGIMLSFRVANLDEAIAYLEAHGVEMVNQPIDFPYLGFISACFRDPDGNLIELQKLL